jgi:DNA primase
VFKTLMYQALAEKTGIDVESLKRLQPPPAPRPQRVESGAQAPSASETAPPMEQDAQPPEDSVPMEEPALQSLSPSSLNPIHRLIGLLVLKPALVGNVPDNLLVTEGSRDAVLLSEIVAHIRQYPEVTTAALLGFWFGTPEGDFLNALAGRETIEEDAGLEALCIALIEKLCRHPALNAARQQFEALKRKPYGELTQEEKQALLSLTQEIRTLSGRT